MSCVLLLFQSQFLPCKFVLYHHAFLGIYRFQTEIMPYQLYSDIEKHAMIYYSPDTRKNPLN